MLFSYDVFISYSTRDRHWVRHWLLPRLESAGFKVCIDSRDFDIGAPSMVNMERAVERSQKTILVLTPNWLESEWTTFEALLASSLDPAGQRQRLIPLLLTKCDLPTRLRLLTYADFTAEADKDAQFERLALSIRGTEEQRGSGSRYVSAGSEAALVVYKLAITRLLALQYPWGEWSDRRTTLESTIAERRAIRGLEGPKPNVARTLFAIEALEPIRAGRSPYCRRRAIDWMVSGIQDGWYREWATSQSLDSEISLPGLFRRKDVRHTAQVAGALCRWNSLRDPLASMVESAAGSRLPSGFWPESPTDTKPRLLASVYCLETLGYVLGAYFRIPVEDLLGEQKAAEIWSAFRYGLAALHEEADRGGGLLGKSFGTPTAYLTGIALYRLAPLAGVHPDLAALAEKLIEGLTAAQGTGGWIDASSPARLQESTRKRTTLRVIAGLGRSEDSGLPVASGLMETMLELAIRIGCENYEELDSPDFACLASVLASIAEGVSESLDLQSVEEEAAILNSQYRLAWQDTFEDYIQRLEQGVELGLPNYDLLSEDLQFKLSFLEVGTDGGVGKAANPTLCGT
jgi:TIR domain-containing protein